MKWWSDMNIYYTQAVKVMRWNWLRKWEMLEETKKDMEFCVLKKMSSNHDPIKYQEKVIYELGVCKQERKRQRNKTFIWVNASLRHANKGLNRVNLEYEVSCSVFIQPSVLAQLAWQSVGYKVISTAVASRKPKNEQFELIWAELQHSLYTCILIASRHQRWWCYDCRVIFNLRMNEDCIQSH